MSDLAHDSITAIEPDTRPGVVKIKIGRRVAARISERDVAEIGLRTGTPWTAPLAQIVAEAETAEKARAAARRLVNARPRSRAELLAAIVGKGFNESIAERVVAEFERTGIVDDARLAASIAESARSRRPAGRAFVEQKLEARSVDADAATAAAENAFRGVNELEEARQLARDQNARMPGTLDATARARRLFGLLARRGFSEEICEQAVGELVPQDSE